MYWEHESIESWFFNTYIICISLENIHLGSRTMKRNSNIFVTFQIPSIEKEDTSQISYEGQFLVNLCLKLSADHSYCITWLDGVTKLLNKKSPHLSCELICVLCSVLIVRDDEGTTKRALKVLTEVAKLDQAQVLSSCNCPINFYLFCYYPVKLYLDRTVALWRLYFVANQGLYSVKFEM